MMFKPRDNKLIYAFFSWYIKRIIHADFKQFNYNKVDFDPDRSILLLANHFSWWDGFVLFQLNRLHFHKKFHIMITEDNYRKVWFLRYLGSFSVKKNSRSIIETLEYAGNLLNDPQNLVVIFPQGKLYSNHIDRVKFEKGLLNIIKISKEKFQFLFSALFIDFFEHRKPSLNCYIQNWKVTEPMNLQFIAEEYNKHYEKSRLQQTEINS